jgi:zinc transport system substrate-binding protein
MNNDGEKVLDPHFWLSPVLMKEMSKSITDALARVDPEHADEYRERRAGLDNELDTLDGEYRSTLSSCEKKDLVSSHNAFGYLAAEYGLTTLPIAGISPEAEPSPKQMAEIATLVRERDVNAIFFEALVSPRLAETLAQETDVRTLMLNPLEGLEEEDIAFGANYLSVMRENLANIKDALECAE